MHVFWHQRDLRLPDNVGLAAAGEDRVLGVYVHDPDTLAHVGRRQRAFLAHGVRALKRAYRERGGDLLVRRGPADETLPELVAEYDADALHYNRHYHPVWRKRQRRVAAAVDAPVEGHVDRTLVDPARLDERYEHHGAFYRDWRAVPKPDPVDAPEEFVAVEDEAVPPVPDVDVDLPPADYDAARERFDRFLADGIRSYRDTRDDLARAVEAPALTVSRLSPYYATGMLGIREVWTAGETGYPLVDAGMRQLEREGYVHNRPRQVVASFLTKHLLYDWRAGARHFARKLVDYDPAANYANWQWIASTGTDSVDVRIFDPVSQMDKYDADATFVREYVPELRDVPAEKIVEWPTLPACERLAPDYPDPIVDRKDAYGRAKAVYEAALGR